MKSLYWHRGLCDSLENTLESFIQIYEKDIEKKGIEFDIQITSDDILVCHHDKTLKRIYGVDININNITKNDILKYNITTLDDIFKEFVNKNIQLDIEIKTYDETNTTKYKIVNLLINMINKFNIHTQVIISSYDDHIISTLLDHNYTNCGIIIDGNSKITDGRLNSLIRNKMENIIIEKKIIDKYYDICDHMNITIFSLFRLNNDGHSYDYEIVKKYPNCSFVIDNINIFCKSHKK